MNLLILILTADVSHGFFEVILCWFEGILRGIFLEGAVIELLTVNRSSCVF